MQSDSNLEVQQALPATHIRVSGEPGNEAKLELFNCSSGLVLRPHPLKSGHKTTGPSLVPMQATPRAESRRQPARRGKFGFRNSLLHYPGVLTAQNTVDGKQNQCTSDFSLYLQYRQQKIHFPVRAVSPTVFQQCRFTYPNHGYYRLVNE